MSHIRSVAATALIGLAVCSDQPAAPTTDAAQGAIKFWEVNATVRWNKIAREQTTLTHPGLTVSQQSGTRAFAYLSLAQYNAVVAAERAQASWGRASVAAAVAGASAVVLSDFYPDQTSYFGARVLEQESSPQWAGENHTDVAAGEALGRQIGSAVVSSANSDGFTASWLVSRLRSVPGAGSAPQGRSRSFRCWA
jgi:hypothetical protein